MSFCNGRFFFSTHHLMVNIQIFWLQQLFLANLFPIKHISWSKVCIYQHDPDDKAETLAVFLSKSYWASFCSLLLSIVLIFSLTIIFLNLKMGYLVVKLYRPLNMKMVLSKIFVKLHEIFKLIIRQVIWCNLLKFIFVRYFHDKIICRV